MNRRGKWFSSGSALYASHLEDAPSVRATMRESCGITDPIERTLGERHNKSGAWTVNTFYHERVRAEDDLSRLLRMQSIRTHARVTRGFEVPSRVIADLYRVPRAGKLQVSLD